jgi:hypothetical protein
MNYKLFELKYRIYKWWSDLWYPVSRTLFPRQRWLTKKIPNTWVDKDWLWELCLIEGLKHYVEQDGGNGWFDVLDDDSKWKDEFTGEEYQAASRKFHREAKEHYDLVTKTLPALELQNKAAWDAIPPETFDLKNLNDPNRPPYHITYAEVDRTQKEIDDLKTKVMLWCINNRASIWT